MRNRTQHLKYCTFQARFFKVKFKTGGLLGNKASELKENMNFVV